MEILSEGSVTSGGRYARSTQEDEKAYQVSANPFPKEVNEENSLKELIEKIIGAERIGSIRYWSEMSAYLPKPDPQHKRFIKLYFRSRVTGIGGRKKEAKRQMEGLVKKTGFAEFEEGNLPLLAFIDIAVTGHTRWFNPIPKPGKPPKFV